MLSRFLTAISDGLLQSLPTNAADNSQLLRYRDSLYISSGVIMYGDRVVIPSSLRHSVLDILHSAHQGVSGMSARAKSIVFWPGITADIHRRRAQCTACNKIAPSQAKMPPVDQFVPSTPFEAVFADFFGYSGSHYLIAGDRLSGWTEIYRAPHGTHQAGSDGLISALRSLFATFGVPEELSSDGGPEFISNKTTTFLSKWGVRHRLSSAHFPKSNGRAEVAVKKCKRLPMENISASGSLNNDKLLRALLQVRNTPDPDCNLSPAQVIFGRPIRDAFSFMNRIPKFDNVNIRPT